MSNESARGPSPGESPLPPTVEVFHADCTLALHRATSGKTRVGVLRRRPRVFVLGLEGLTALDARGVGLIQLLGDRCRSSGTKLIIGGAGSQARAMLARAGLLDELGLRNVFPRMREALIHARTCARR